MDDLFHEMPGAMVSEQSSVVSKGLPRALSNAMKADKAVSTTYSWPRIMAHASGRQAPKVGREAERRTALALRAIDPAGFMNPAERGARIKGAGMHGRATMQRSGKTFREISRGQLPVSKSYEEISKLGPPKASGYVWSPVDSTTRAPKERKSQGSYWYKGKSLILRRPKYEFAVLPKFKKGDDYDNTYFTRQKYKGGGKEFHAAHTSGKKLSLNGVDYKNVSKAALPTKWNGMMQGIPRATSRMKGSKFQVFGPPGAGRTKMAGPGMNMPAHKPSWAKPLPGPKRTKVDMNKRPPSVWD